MKLITSLAAGIILCIICCGCEIEQGITKFKQPTASLKNVRLTQADANDVKLVFEIQVDNPYCVSLPLTNIDYRMTVGKAMLISGGAEVDAKVLPGQSIVVELPADISQDEFIQTFGSFKPGAKIAYEADVGLLVDTPVIGPVRMPLEKTGSIESPSKK
ncbi:MAG: LEA type 2 family protein [Phycisphaerae bacterium]|jgi:LEA14-like dessication related protein